MSSCLSPALADDVQSLLTRAGTAHGRQLAELREEISNLREENLILRGKFYDANPHSELHTLGPHSGDTLPFCYVHSGLGFQEPFGTADIMLEDNRRSISRVESIIDKQAGLVEQWLNFSGRLLEAKDPINLRLLRARRRWLLMSSNLMDLCVEGREPRNHIKGRKLNLVLLSVWTWRTRKAASCCLHHPDSFQRSSEAMDHISSRAGYTLTDKFSACIMHPDHMPSLVWSALSGMIVLYELYMTPLGLSYLATAPVSVTLATSVFWVIDLCICCCTGVETRDCLVDMRFRTIICAYLKSWFLPDLFVIFIDLLLLGADDAISAARTNKFLRLFRLLRFLRLRKLGEASRVFFNSIYVSYFVLLARCGKYVLVVFTVNHYIACFWYGLTMWSHDHVDELSWLEAADPGASKNSVTSYIYSLHWALTQVSPATQNIIAQNPNERTYSLCVALLALVLFSSFVGKITAALNEFFVSKGKRQGQELLMRDFFQHHRISTMLGARILAHFHKTYDKSKGRVMEQTIDYFSEVPESMMLLLHEEIYMDVLLGNIYFRHFAYTMEHRGTLLKICHKSMSELSVQPCEDIFIVGSGAQCVYTIIRGAMSYKYRMTTSEAHAGNWVSELGLWVKWEHVGSMTASTRTDLAIIRLVTFHDMLASGGESLYEPFRSIAVYTMHQVEVEASKGGWPTDMPLSEQLQLSSVRSATRLRDRKSGGSNLKKSVRSSKRFSFSTFWSGRSRFSQLSHQSSMSSSCSSRS